MKILQKISQEIVPLSRRQNIVLLIIIACIFQFVLFYAPALADEAAQQAPITASDTVNLISNDSVSKTPLMDQEAAQLATTTALIASSTADIATSSPDIASSTPDKVIKTSTHVITAYNSEVAQTDDDPCTTANGFNVCQHNQEDTIAANFLQFGTKVKIPELFGDRVFVVRDRMNRKHADRIDVWMKGHQEAMQFGIKVAKIQVVE